MYLTASIQSLNFQQVHSKSYSWKVRKYHNVTQSLQHGSLSRMTTSYVFLSNDGAVGVTEEHYTRLLAGDFPHVFPCNVFFCLIYHW